MCVRVCVGVLVFAMYQVPKSASYWQNKDILGSEDIFAKDTYENVRVSGKACV